MRFPFHLSKSIYFPPKHIRIHPFAVNNVSQHLTVSWILGIPHGLVQEIEVKHSIDFLPLCPQRHQKLLHNVIRLSSALEGSGQEIFECCMHVCVGIIRTTQPYRCNSV